MKFQFKSLVLSVVIGLSLLVACSKGNNVNTSNNHPVDMLRQDVGSEVPTLDPLLSQDVSSTRVLFDLFGGLIDFNQQNDPIPGMASSWDISKDGKTYTFHLRKDLKFSDGSPIYAKDFVYSWRRLVNPKTASPYNFLLSSVVNADKIIANKASPDTLSVLAPDKYTLVVKLNYPDRDFLKKISMPDAYVVPQKVIEKYAQAWTDPSHIVTSGAYMLKEHVVNGYILATKNPYYYDAKNVNIPQVKYLPYEENNTTIPSYKAGGVDVTFQAVPVDQYAELGKIYGKQLHTVVQEAVYYYDFNMKDPRFADNIKLREALSMAVDRDALVNQVLKEGQKPLYSIVTPTVDNGAYADVVYGFATWPRDKQIEEARKLFAQAGYSPIHPLVFSVSYNTNDLHKRVALAITAMWKQVFGNAIKVSLQNQDWKTFIQARVKADYQVARDGWVSDYSSVTSYANLYSCGKQVNNSHYCNPKYNDLIREAMYETDPVKQVALIKQALWLPMNAYATIPLFQYSYQQLVKPYVKGYNPDNNHLEYVQSKWMSIEK